MKMTDRITRRIIAQFNDEMPIPNYYVGWHEADVWVIRDSGYQYEFEVKVSRADYLADFKNKPQRHQKLADGTAVANKFYFAVPEGLIRPDEVPAYAGLYYFKENDWTGSNGKRMIGTTMTLVKEAKLLHKNKTQVSALARSFHFRKKTLREKYLKLKAEFEYIQSYQKLNELKDENKILREKLDAHQIHLMKYEWPRQYENYKDNDSHKKYFPEDLEKSSAPPDI